MYSYVNFKYLAQEFGLLRRYIKKVYLTKESYRFYQTGKA